MLQGNEKSVLFATGRQVLYFCGCFVLMLFQWRTAMVCQEETFAEGRIIENLQLAFLALALISFGCNAILRLRTRGLSLFCGGCCALAFCRELDSVLDAALPAVSWRIGFAFPLLAIVYILRHRNQFRSSLFLFLQTPAVVMLFSALVVIIPVAQMIGHHSFLKAILVNIEHINHIKELFEEAAELIGYFIVFCASLELHFNLRQKEP